MMVGEVARLLRERGQALWERGATLAVAESCTGGRVAAAFTARAGASEYFLCGVVAYANEVKVNVLEVCREDLVAHGAVSREVAEQMALGVRRISGADFAVATTGIAGPGGGSAEKPVGTVWMAVAGPGSESGSGGGSGEAGGKGVSVVSRRFLFDGTRAEIMEAATGAAIEMLRVQI